MNLFRRNYHILLISLFASILFFSCGTTRVEPAQVIEEPEISESDLIQAEEIDDGTISLLFAGDIMAHSVNYVISDYPKIWRDVKYIIEPADLAFANIEAPVDDTKKPQNYPNFNMPQSYVEAAIDAGFDVFSLCNNHTNDQGLSGIQETQKTSKRLVQRSKERGEEIYFSGLKDGKKADFTYNLIEKKGWKILFLPVTEILNQPSYSDYINFIENSESARNAFITKVKELRQKNPCDLFVISIHANETEYTRTILDWRDEFYMQLLQAGADIIWANHAHIIKDRKYIFYHETNSQKVIMYANGNTISGQRTKPELTSSNPTGERDNTGDGLMVKLTFKKQENGNPPTLINSENFFITTYINTANEYVVKPLNQDFIDYLWEVPRSDWARYIKRRIEINKKYTKDIILWQ
ncbi:MAG: CapA family protein [Treponema sp.]|nr:CapA family protein [Treponema sp.]